MKLKLTVQKKFTINTNNYTSISPTLTIEVVDGIDAEKLSDAHLYLSNIADILFHDQLKDDAITMATIKKIGLGDYIKSLDQEKMDEKYEELMQKLIHVNEEDVPF